MVGFGECRMVDPIGFGKYLTVEEFYPDGLTLDLSEKLSSVAELDDKEEFLRLIKSPEFEKHLAYFYPARLLYDLDSLNCAIAIMNGETGDLFDNFRDVQSKAGVTPLHIAAVCSAPNITKFLLKRGDKVDVKCNTEMLKLKQATPFDIAIEIFAFNGRYAGWVPGQSIFELVLLLCDFRQRQILDVARLIVQNTPREQVEKAFLSYVDQRKLVQVAVLCMVAPELLVPSHIAPTDGLRIVDVILLLKYKNSQTEMDKGLLLLLELFAACGHMLSAYPQLECPDLDLSGVQMSLEVAHLLRKAALYDLGGRSPNDYFLRFFEPVIFEAEEEKQIKSSHRRVPAMAFCSIGSCTLSCLHFDLKRSDIQLDYINSVLPDLKAEDADRLCGAIEKKLSSTSGFRSRPEVMPKISNKGVKVLKEAQPLWFTLRTRQTNPPMAESFHTDQSVLERALDNHFASSASMVNKVESSLKLSAFLSGSVTYRLASVVKRFIK